jgi:N-acetylmuramoyl-L-alanine amidase
VLNKAAILSLLTFNFLLLTSPLRAEATLTVVHPTEGMKVPYQSQIFAFGAVSPGSSITVNGSMIPVHPLGGYLAMIPIQVGENVLRFETMNNAGESVKVDRRITVSEPFQPSPVKPLTLASWSVRPNDSQIVMAGDTIRVSFQGSPGAKASFTIHKIAKDIPMTEMTRNVVDSTVTAQGVYEGSYVIQPEDRGDGESIEITLKSGDSVKKEKARGRITVDHGAIPRVGIVKDDIVAIRSGPEGGYDMFLYKGMRVRLSGKEGPDWRVRLSSLQSGWVKESAIQLLPQGSVARPSVLPNITLFNRDENTLVRVPLQEMLPYRVEQLVDPMQLVITFYGAVANTDLIRYDPLDPLVRQVRWRQLGPDTTQVIIEPRFKTWWGFDARYEGTTFILEVRKPWTASDIKGMVIAIDPGHGGTELGAAGPRGYLEKDLNLQISHVLKNTLEKMGARPFLTREKDVTLSLYERPKIAFAQNARLFISVHCNAAGVSENPVMQNGYSVYWYHPQSQALARSVHARYGKTLNIPDRGLFYADFAVARMTQMPSILTEQAYIIVPEQEALLVSPEFQQLLATSIARGIRDFVAGAKESQ